ncbi:hypothetical protein BDV97DRAFT_172731 [Delphinella strobiligena]|nr:hypothetical protein BDV97DRAFT_172731 [Delphinella strobiligena]
MPQEKDSPGPTPHCAICGGDSVQCGHEDERLKRALSEAQSRWLAGEQMRAIRHWVLTHARETILFTYGNLETTRRQQYEAHLQTLPYFNLWQIYQEGTPLPASQLDHLKLQMRQAYEHMHRTLDKDWQNCLQKYPELLDYYFSLVSVECPDEEDVRVEHPTITNGEKKRKKDKKGRGIAEGFSGVPPMPANVPFGYGRYPAGHGDMPNMPGPGGGPFGAGYPPFQ